MVSLVRLSGSSDVECTDSAAQCIVIAIQFPFVAIFELCKKWLFAQGLVKVTTLCALITGPLGVGLMFLLTIGP